MRAYWEKLESDHAHSPSVVVADATGASVRVTSQCRYSAVDAADANALFDDLDVDVNDYLIEVVSASFDNDKFVDAKGKFNSKCYQDMHAAIAAVAFKYGIENPLRSTVKIVPKPEFHEARAATFTADENLKIYGVMKNTITLTVTDAGVELKPAAEAGSKDEES